MNHIRKDRMLRTRLVTKDGFSTTTYDVRKGICLAPKKEKDIEKSEQGQGWDKGVQGRGRSLRSGPGKGLQRLEVSNVDPDGPLCLKRGECACAHVHVCIEGGDLHVIKISIFLSFMKACVAHQFLCEQRETLLSSVSGLQWGPRQRK